MNVGSRLTVKAYPVTEVCYGEENRVTVDGRMTVCKNIAEKILAQEPLIKEIDIRIIMPDEHRQHTNTVMDVIPLAAKCWTGGGGHYPYPDRRIRDPYRCG